jgi:hypothetical protein
MIVPKPPRIFGKGIKTWTKLPTLHSDSDHSLIPLPVLVLNSTNGSLEDASVVHKQHHNENKRQEQRDPNNAKRESDMLLIISASKSCSS